VSLLPADAKGALQRRQPQLMLLRVVMHFAEQDHGIAKKPIGQAAPRFAPRGNTCGS
jgi:hypothetical protein